ncbi:MAG: M1 family metallopeptidase, partial [Bacteroidota bacterium]
MRYRYFFLLLSFLFFNFQSSEETALSNRVANYEIDVRLDVVEKKLYAHTQLVWKNPSTDTIHDLQFHLYYNAFKNSESTFFRERGLPDLFRTALEEGNWSWTKITKITDQYGHDLTPAMHYIQPDDDNTFDQTVLRVPLPQPVLPNATITVEYDWEARIPKTMIRTGYNKDFYFMAQWYPKVGVYEPAGMRYAEQGAWNCHQYHSSGEYYGEFGNYKVAMTVPKNYMIGSSGTMTGEPKVNQDETKTWTFVVNDVIDFAWGASPHFVESKMNWKGVDVRLLTYPEHEHYKGRIFSILTTTMDYFEEKFEKYPFPSLTVIAPPIHGVFTGGMEYSTLFTTLTNDLLPTGLRSTEILTIHEFVHQYFQQIVASNEMEEAWMDEGITNFYEGKVMDMVFGEKTSTLDFMGLRAGNAEMDRATLFDMENPAIAPNSLNSWEFPGGSYHDIQYSKSAVWLTTLERLLGSEVFEEVMRTYYLRWKFKHPCAQDFVDVVNEVVKAKLPDDFGEGMDWFFQQALYGTEICDYAVTNISNEPKRTRAGIFADEDTPEQFTPMRDTNDNLLYGSSVEVQRMGNMTLPVEVRIIFADGTEITEKWDGLATYKSFYYERSSQIECAEIDPQHKLFL